MNLEIIKQLLIAAGYSNLNEQPFFETGHCSWAHYTGSIGFTHQLIWIKLSPGEATKAEIENLEAQAQLHLSGWINARIMGLPNYILISPVGLCKDVTPSNILRYFKPCLTEIVPSVS
jgi:hypothetical protein